MWHSIVGVFHLLLLRVSKRNEAIVICVCVRRAIKKMRVVIPACVHIIEKFQDEKLWFHYERQRDREMRTMQAASKWMWNLWMEVLEIIFSLMKNNSLAPRSSSNIKNKISETTNFLLTIEHLILHGVEHIYWKNITL